MRLGAGGTCVACTCCTRTARWCSLVRLSKSQTRRDWPFRSCRTFGDRPAIRGKWTLRFKSGEWLWPATTKGSDWSLQWLVVSCTRLVALSPDRKLLIPLARCHTNCASLLLLSFLTHLESRADFNFEKEYEAIKRNPYYLREVLQLKYTKGSLFEFDCFSFAYS